jgi:hypothetical protein
MKPPHFGNERGEEIGEVVIFDEERMDADPVRAANTEEGASGAMVTLIPSALPDSSGANPLVTVTLH